MKTEQTELVQLHMAMTEYFDEAHVDQISLTIWGAPYDRRKAPTKRDKVRELLLALRRRRRIPELVDLCRQLDTNFSWQERDLSPLYQAPGLVTRIDAERLVITLAHQFSLDDLRQVCFYLGIDFEEIPGPHGSWPGELSEADQRWLRNQRPEYASLSAEELDILYKKKWAENLVSQCKAEGIWEQLLAVCYWLHPETF